MILKNRIKFFFARGNIRSIKAKKNIVASILLKGISIAIGLVYVPLLIDFLGTEEYGVWLTLSSIIGWFTFFDIGLGNGMRNKLTEALAKDDFELAKSYVSTTYAILGIIFSSVLLILHIVIPLLDWNILLNVHTIPLRELILLAQVVFTFFFLRFIFKLIGTIYNSYQIPAINNAIGPVSNIICLLIIIFLIQTSDGSLVLLGLTLSAIPVVVLIILTIVSFNGIFKNIKPSTSYINFKYAKDIWSLGIKFFIVQAAALILFSTSNIIIAQLLGPKEVTIYNIGYKFYSLVYMAISITITPMWSAVTDAYAKNDYLWLKTTISKYNRIGFVFLFFLLIQLLVSNYAFKLWVGDRVHIPYILSIAFVFDFGISCFTAVYSQFVNGFGKLKLSMYTVWIKLFIFLILAIVLTKHFGVSGIVWASAIGKLMNIVSIIQVHKLVNKSANGIWNK